jgi:hypothetical protein
MTTIAKYNKIKEKQKTMSFKKEITCSNGLIIHGGQISFDNKD